MQMQLRRIGGPACRRAAEAIRFLPQKQTLGARERAPADVGLGLESCHFGWEPRATDGRSVTAEGHGSGKCGKTAVCLLGQPICGRGGR